MEQTIPATPAAAPAATATPGPSAAIITPPSANAAPAPAAAAAPVGQVTISTEEFRRLQRADARTKAFERRAGRPAPTAKLDPNDPNASATADAIARAEQAEARAMQAEVRGKVRDLLSTDKYKNIPDSTKKLILEKPHMLSDAETLEDAMFDIEDKLDEYALSSTPLPGQPTAPITPAASRETPPATHSGAPAPVDAGVVVDTSNLRGTARSVGVLKNAFLKATPGATT